MGRETNVGSIKGSINLELMRCLLLIALILVLNSCSKTVIIHGREYERPTREEI